jgi:hypothetical protein
MTQNGKSQVVTDSLPAKDVPQVTHSEQGRNLAPGEPSPRRRRTTADKPAKKKVGRPRKAATLTDEDYAAVGQLYHDAAKAKVDVNDYIADLERKLAAWRKMHA